MQRVKYGVVSSKRLQEDLLHWNDLFVAGRLHKPVIHIIRGNLDVAQSISSNLDAALRLALLLLPPRFSERVRSSKRIRSLCMRHVEIICAQLISLTWHGCHQAFQLLMRIYRHQLDGFVAPALEGALADKSLMCACSRKAQCPVTLHTVEILCL